MADIDDTASEFKTEADEFFDDADLPDAPADDLLEVMRKFVQGYTKNLKEFQEALAESMPDSTWDALMDPIALNLEPFDRQHMVHMVKSNNEQFNKVTTVFVVLCAEMKELSEMASTKFYGALTMFGHTERDIDELDPDDDDEKKTDEKKDDPPTPEAQMGTFLPFLQDLANFVGRIYTVTRNVINQLACLYHEKQKLYSTTYKKVHLEYVWECLAELLRVPLTLDTIITDNGYIELAWNSYKRMIKYIRADPERYGVANDKLRSFETLLLQVDRQILSANIFQGCIAQDFGLPGAASSKALVSGNRVFFNELKDILGAFRKRYTAGLGDTVEIYPRTVFVDLFCLYALHRRLFIATSKPDKSLYKQLWEIQKKVPIVHLYGRSVWLPADFLLAHAPLQISVSPSLKDVSKVRAQCLRAVDDAFVRQVEHMYEEMCTWMVRIESELATAQAHNISAVLHARSKLLLNGLLLALQLRTLILTEVFLHLHLEKPFIAKNVRAIAVCAEMLKAIEQTYHRRTGMIGENIPHMIGQTAFTLQRIFAPVKKKLEKPGKRINETQMHVLAATNLSLRLLANVPTTSRRNVLKVALATAQLKGTLKSSHQEEVNYQIWKLDLLSGFQRRIQQTAQCDWLYWVLDLLPAFLQDIHNNTSQAHRMQYLLKALEDPRSLLNKVEHQANKDHYLHAYQNEVLTHLKMGLIDPLCREVERDLRLHVHSVVLQQANLVEKNAKDLSRFLSLKPLVFFDRLIDVKAKVTHYLDYVFYNLNTVTLHDWRIYAEMRNLAWEKFQLAMTEVHLPGHAHYSEALDVLEIMRNIHIFVARYNYNLNTQTFVERVFDQKHLNSINITHISNSIRTHGSGIMNTTVNFTYQFLCRKFIIFSEFLFDDYIKSRLMKDIRYFKNERAKLDNKFPWARADKFCQQIRKLGVTDGLTFLDRFRQQITEIGNAMGYVRMVRSGGMQYISDAIKYVPDLEDIASFEAMVVDVSEKKQDDDEDEEEKKEDAAPAKPAQPLANETIEAAKNLDMVLDDLSRNFAEGTEYFSVLVNTFQGVFRGDSQAHLRNFYMIIPALSMNFVDKMMQQKETLKKKGGRGEAAFTDDGFSLGIAYILTLLNQFDDFDSLHWWDSVNLYISAKRNVAKEHLNKKRLSSEDKQHYQLTLKRLNRLQRELELLFYSFSGARIFFRDALVQSQEAEEERKRKEEEEKKAAADAPAADASDAAPPADDAGAGPAPPAAPPAAAAPPSAPPAPPAAPPAAAPTGAPPPPPPVPPGDLSSLVH